MIDNLLDYYAHRASRTSARDNEPGHLPDRGAWQAMRPEIHRQFLASLGLERLPERCDLRRTVTGTFRGAGYTAEKIAYQLLPDVWGSAHLYRPDARFTGPLPAVLYACGHHLAGVVGYQHHPIAWARRGYACLIFDTIEQHDNPGEHHGLHRGRLPAWISMGYTAAGGEVFNGMRALDLLLQEPGIDAKRIGVTGMSGGGSQAFRLAAADDRLRAVATIAGVSDPAFAIANGTIEQHCDCMYEHNPFGRDLTVWAALIAPRALLYGYARHDNLYTPDEFRTLFRHTRARYAALGLDDRCQLTEYDGPHGYNHRTTCDAIHAWFDEHVAGEPHPLVDTLAIAASGELHREPTLSVFHGQTPEPNRLDLLPDLLSTRGQVRLPDDAEQWRRTQAEAVERLKHGPFRLLDDVAEGQRLTQVGDWTYGGTDRLQWRGELDGMGQSITQLDASGGSEQPVIVAAADRKLTAVELAAAVRTAAGGRVSGLGIEPRGAGRRAPHPSAAALLAREGCLVGLTPTMLLVQDLHHLWPHLLALPRVSGRAIYLYGRGEGAVAMLYHALLHPAPAVRGIILEDLPRSHRDGDWPILGILKVMDLAHAVGLLAPRRVILIGPGGTSFDWYWADRAHARLRERSTLSRAPSLTAAIEAMIGPVAQD